MDLAEVGRGRLNVQAAAVLHVDSIVAVAFDAKACDEGEFWGGGLAEVVGGGFG